MYAPAHPLARLPTITSLSSVKSLEFSPYRENIRLWWLVARRVKKRANLNGVKKSEGVEKRKFRVDIKFIIIWKSFPLWAVTKVVRFWWVDRELVTQNEQATLIVTETFHLYMGVRYSVICRCEKEFKSSEEQPTNQPTNQPKAMIQPVTLSRM